VTLGGVSGGPVVLARAGLMGGRRMTVHWEHAPALAEISPALMDLMHALIARRHGAGFARRVSDWFLHTDIRPSSGPQRAGRVERWGTANRAVLDAIAAMESHVADPLSLDQLATIAGLSPRHLNRLFRAKLGRSTMGLYRELRLETARNLVRNSSLAMTEIALATGFASSAHFSRAHSACYGLAPSALRA
jgi:transcriptional regulator GlxA family with amidase domain